MIPRDLHFAHPQAFWNVFWLIPLLLILLWARYRKKKDLTALISPKLLPYVLLSKDPWMDLLRILCFVLGWFLAVIALMQPMGNGRYPESRGKSLQAVPSLDLHVLIDTSQSMNVADTQNQQTRLEVALDIADRLISDLKGDQVALNSLTSQLTPLVPLTSDRTFARLFLREIHVNEGDQPGTDFATVLSQLANKISSKPSQAVLLFSDGEDTTATNVQKIRDIVEAMKVPIFTVGVGSKEGGTVPNILWEGKPVISHHDATLLEAIAKASGGRFWEGSISTAQEIAQALDQRRLAQGKTSAASTVLYSNYFQIPLALASLFFFLSYSLPQLRNRTVLSLLFISFSLHASANQGEQLFEAEQYKSAAAWYRDQLNQLPPAWLRDKLLYNLAISLEELGEWHAAVTTLSAISKEAFRYPIFKANILNNQMYALSQEANKLQGNARAIKLLEAAWIGSLLNKEISSEPLTSPLTDEEQNLLVEALIRTFKLSFEEQHKFFSQAKPYLPEKIEEQLHSLQSLLLKRTLQPQEFLERASSFISSEEEFIKAADQFYAVVLTWQKQHFQKGECQCTPWDQVLPLFTAGLTTLRDQKGELAEAYAYAKWQAALELLKNPPHSTEEQKNENSELRELREMQDLDREPKKVIKPSGSGRKPW